VKVKIYGIPAYKGRDERGKIANEKYEKSFDMIMKL